MSTMLFSSAAAKRDAAKKEYARKTGARGQAESARGQIDPCLDYYKVLDLECAATAKEIKVRYMKLALTHHPDRQRNKGVVDEQMQKEWASYCLAYDCLSDPEKRTIYDERLPLRAAVVMFYESHNKLQLKSETIDAILEKYDGLEIELLEALHQKYDAKPFCNPGKTPKLKKNKPPKQVRTPGAHRYLITREILAGPQDGNCIVSYPSARIFRNLDEKTRRSIKRKVTKQAGIDHRTARLLRRKRRNKNTEKENTEISSTATKSPAVNAAKSLSSSNCAASPVSPEKSKPKVVSPSALHDFYRYVCENKYGDQGDAVVTERLAYHTGKITRILSPSGDINPKVASSENELINKLVDKWSKNGGGDAATLGALFYFQASSSATDTSTTQRKRKVSPPVKGKPTNNTPRASNPAKNAGSNRANEKGTAVSTGRCNNTAAVYEHENHDACSPLFLHLQQLVQRIVQP